MSRLHALSGAISVFICVATLFGCASPRSTESGTGTTETRLSNRGAMAFTISASGKSVSAKHASSDRNTFYIDETKEKRIGITVVPVRSHQLSSKLEFSSTVEAPTEHSGIVTSVMHGVVTRVLADLGDSVKAGQVLCYISSPDISEAQSCYLTAVAKVQEARAQLQQTKMRVGLAKADVEREKLLYKEGISSLKDLQSAQAKEATVNSELAAATALVTAELSHQASARARLTSLGLSTKSLNDQSISYELPLKSPITGVVVQRTVAPGQSVGPVVSGISPTDPHSNVFTIADLAKVWVMLEVPQAEVSRLKLDTPVEFRTEVAPDRVFEGRVTRLGQNFDAYSRTVAVRTEIPNPNMVLKPGMLILATVMLDGAGRNVLSVPVNAVQQIDNQDLVFLKVAEHTYRKCVVTLGRRTQEFVELLGGLKPGQEIVSDGSFFLKSEAVKTTLGTGAAE
jgi:membrane fusion protein, heavy metal efflux system